MLANASRSSAENESKGMHCRSASRPAGNFVSMPKRRLATATSEFGSGKRESHDSTPFYARFPAPLTSPDEIIGTPVVRDELFVGDAREMTDDHVADRSVALMITSPPYFAGKEYETDLARGHVPASYAEYLEMLTEVFAITLHKLEPGGRMAVNVANLGRKPYRSLSSDVISILQDDLGMLMRGEIIWQKAKGAGGSCAWGSFRSPQNPVLRDVTERIILASKGRFDRAVKRSEREKRGLPHEATIETDEFLESTLDVWEIPSERATSVGHPAPFPVALPRRLIELFTYRDDLVLDPFMGSGSTALAAVETGRHYVGFDTERAYVELARQRIAAVEAGV
jgi:site-specific DNA-methyltransferase (adenine-specific)